MSRISLQGRLIERKKHRATVTTGDFNGDWKADLAVSDWTLNAIAILHGNGDATFSEPVGAWR